jgi:lipopolysaccharide export system permease protein
MRLHDRYLFRELLTPLAYCLGGFLVFWLSVFFFTELEHMQESKLHFGDTVEYALAMLPGFFVQVLPVTLLLALLYALTHHARHNEITALRAAGVGLWRLCAPYFVVGLLAAGIYFAVNEIAVPRGDQWAAEILKRYVKNENEQKSKTRFTKGFANPRAHRIWKFSEYDSVSTVMIVPNVAWTLPDGSLRVLRADRAVRTNGVWTFFNAQLLKGSGPHGELVPTASTNVLAMPELDETPARIVLLLKFSDTQTLRGSRSADIPLAELWGYLRNNPGLSAEDEAALLTKFHGRLAAPWTCLVVVLMAIPFGAQSGRRNLFFGVAGSIFICFSYFVLQAVFFTLGMSGHLPGWLAAWLPNFIFAATGIILTLRTR